MSNIVYLNGEFIEQSQAKISVLDRGFLFADGIYEVIPVYQKQLFRFTQHIERLALCLKQVNITNPHNQQQWRALIKKVIERNKHSNLSIYIHITHVRIKRDLEHVPT